MLAVAVSFLQRLLQWVPKLTCLFLNIMCVSGKIFQDTGLLQTLVFVLDGIILVSEIM